MTEETFRRMKKRLGRTPKMALGIRRSAGEGGNTAQQLEQLISFVEGLEKKGLIRKVDRRVKGRSPVGEWRGVDLDRPGDIYNEGEGTSGFNVAERPVFMALLEDLRQGEYDGVLAVSMDRYARNYGALSRYAYDLWGEVDPPRLFYGFAERTGLGSGGQQGIIDEKVLASLMEWGGLAKQLEIKKAETKRTGTNVEKGYLLGSRPEWLGKEYRGKTSKGVKYRAAFDAIKAGGSPAQIARAAGKFDKTGRPERGFTRNWKKRLLAYEELGVLDAWFDAVDAVNDFIRDMGGYPKNAFKSTEVTNILRASAGYFAYPAGVLLVDGDGMREFVRFPYPLDIGLDRLAGVKDASTLDDFVVVREEYKDEPVLVGFQTQPRAGEGRDGKKKMRR